MSEQSANAVVMIRPSRFYPNPETALDNAFQQEVEAESSDTLTARARAEFDEAVRTLSAAAVKVHVFDDTLAPEKPDAVFPNNWFSTHHDGRIALYPMYTPSRRAERRHDIIASLQQHYRVSGIVDYSPYEERGLYLEGTGSLVLDHENRIAYVSLSRRADRELLEKFCADFDYEPVTFQSSGDDGRPIYHTNVMLCVGTQFVLVGLEMIDDPAQRETVRSSPCRNRQNHHRPRPGSNRQLRRERARVAERPRKAARSFRPGRFSSYGRTAHDDRTLRPAPPALASHDRAGRRQRALHDGDGPSASPLGTSILLTGVLARPVTKGSPVPGRALRGAWRSRCYCHYVHMAEPDPIGGKRRPKRKSAALTPERGANGSRKPRTPAGNNVVPPNEPPPPVVTRMERTRRLLLAALRVWELKRRPRD